MVFGTIMEGSSPSGRTKEEQSEPLCLGCSFFLLLIKSKWVSHLCKQSGVEKMPKRIVVQSESPENPVFRDFFTLKLAFWIHSYPAYEKLQYNNSTKPPKSQLFNISTLKKGTMLVPFKNLNQVLFYLHICNLLRKLYITLNVFLCLQ